MKRVSVTIVLSMVLIASVFASLSVPIEIEAKVGYAKNFFTIKMVAPVEWSQSQYLISGIEPGVFVSFEIMNDFAIEAGFGYLFANTIRINSVTSSGDDSQKVDKDNTNFDSYEMMLGARYTFDLSKTIDMSASAGVSLLKANFFSFNSEGEIASSSLIHSGFGAYLKIIGEYEIKENFSLFISAEASSCFMNKVEELMGSNWVVLNKEKLSLEDFKMVNVRLLGSVGACYKF